MLVFNTGSCFLNIEDFDGFWYLEGYNCFYLIVGLSDLGTKVISELLNLIGFLTISICADS